MENPDLTPNVIVENSNFTVTSQWPFYRWSILALYQNATSDEWFS